AFQEVALFDFKYQPLRLATFDQLVLDVALKIEHNRVAYRHRAVSNRLQGRLGFSHIGKGPLQRIGRQLRFRDFDGYALIITELDFRAHFKLGCQFEWRAQLEIARIDFWLGYHIEILVHNGAVQHLGYELLECFSLDVVDSQALLDDVSRSLA